MSESAGLPAVGAFADSILGAWSLGVCAQAVGQEGEHEPKNLKNANMLNKREHDNYGR